MIDVNESKPTYSLWTEPWITVEDLNGGLVKTGVAEALQEAHKLNAIHDPSPLVVAAIHRLLTAVIHDIVRPVVDEDLIDIWESKRFPAGQITAFGERYADRFDLFSAEKPFLQSADLPLEPSKRAAGMKPVSYLTKEIPAGTEVTHYWHGEAEENVFCPTCAARGLVTVPAFATSGGAGIKPSINGVPPIYVLPADDTLFASLTASLVLPDFQPDARSRTEDRVWWRHDPIVERKAVVHEVGYLHSLTFPARRVRLHPEPMRKACSRCGRRSEWGVRTMIFRMGESRPKKAQPWRDPFAAYRPRKKDLIPIRPVEGKALWRDYAALFLPSQEDDKEATLPPAALYQRAELAADRDNPVGPKLAIYPVRCIGMRTDMRAKVFEWIDAAFSVPAALARDPLSAGEVRRGLDFATQCARTIAGTFRHTFNEEGNRDHHATLRQRMLDAYWRELATPFRQFVLDLIEVEDWDPACARWADRVVRTGNTVFRNHAEMVGHGGEALRRRVEGRKWCAIRLSKNRKEYLPDE
jgi:CRISPR system Cascade subunit CasA